MENALMKNDDLKRYIYSFGYCGHRVFMRQICNELNTTLTEPTEILGWPQESLDGESLCCFVNRTYTKEQIIELFNLYRYCYCCTRHSYYKPTLFSAKKNDKPDPNPHYTYQEECSCNCRNTCRHLYVGYWHN